MENAVQVWWRIKLVAWQGKTLKVLECSVRIVVAMPVLIFIGVPDRASKIVKE